MKTKEELNTLKEEFETVSKKLAELSEEELAQVTAGVGATLGFLPIFVAAAVGGAFECSLCDPKSTIAIKALANHLVNFHGYSRENAMETVPEEYRSMQWN